MKNKSILLPIIVILLTAAVLLGASAGLSSVRAANIQAEHVRMMQTLLPGSGDFVREIYTGEDAAVRSVHKAENGFVVETVVDGYAEEIAYFVQCLENGVQPDMVTPVSSENAIKLAERIATEDLTV